GGAEEIELTDLADVGIDDEVSDPFEELIEAGDESRDPVGTATEAARELTRSAPTATTEPTATIPADATLPVAPIQRALPGMGEVQELFAQLQFRREPTGKVVIEATPQAASTLSALFEGMAALLQTAVQPTD